MQQNQIPYDIVLMDWKMPGMDGVECIRVINEQSDAPPAVIMVTAYGREEAMRNALSMDVEIKSILSKPVTPSSLLDAIGETLGRGIMRSERRGRESGKRHEAMAHLRGANVLLVEDNEINQELALELLTNGGVTVKVADNGQIALDILEMGHQFDGILMDVQMPVMDGYTASRNIRKNEKYDELPIIAMTANAMAGDREKCLEAGMNDHISKPISVREMFSTMAKWITPTNPIEIKLERRSTDKAYQGELPIIAGVDTEAGLVIAQGNRELYRRLLIKFYDSQFDFAEQFAAAIESDDPDAAERCAHTLKGVAANIGAQGIQRAATDLEQSCDKSAPDDGMDMLLNAVTKELAPVIEGLAKLKDVQAISEKTSLTSNENIDMDAISPLLDNLQELLEEDDTEATELFDKLLESPGVGKYGTPIKNISRLIESYEFEDALEELVKLRLKMEESENG
jgi:CheY-like chemotaxis protein